MSSSNSSNSSGNSPNSRRLVTLEPKSEGYLKERGRALAKRIVLSGESEAEFMRLVDEQVERFGPLEFTEFIMVENMVACYWRMLRAQKIKKIWLAEAAAELTETDPDLRAEAASFALAATKKYKQLHRYEMSMSRRYKQSHSMLLKLIKLRPFKQAHRGQKKVVEFPAAAETPATAIDPRLLAPPSGKEWIN